MLLETSDLMRRNFSITTALPRFYAFLACKDAFSSFSSVPLLEEITMFYASLIHFNERGKMKSFSSLIYQKATPSSKNIVISPGNSGTSVGIPQRSGNYRLAPGTIGLDLLFSLFVLMHIP